MKDQQKEESQEQRGGRKKVKIFKVTENNRLIDDCSAKPYNVK